MGSAKKAAVAVLGAVVMAVASAITDDHIFLAEWVMISIAGFAAFQVWYTANGPVGTAWHYAKAVTAGALAGLGLLGGWLAAGQHVTNAMWVNVAVAVLVAAGVFKVDGAPEHP